MNYQRDSYIPFLLSEENPQLDWGFSIALAMKNQQKTSYDI